MPGRGSPSQGDKMQRKRPHFNASQEFSIFSLQRPDGVPGKHKKLRRRQIGLNAPVETITGSAPGRQLFPLGWLGKAISSLELRLKAVRISPMRRALWDLTSGAEAGFSAAASKPPVRKPE